LPPYSEGWHGPARESPRGFPHPVERIAPVGQRLVARSRGTFGKSLSIGGRHQLYKRGKWTKEKAFPSDRAKTSCQSYVFAIELFMLNKLQKEVLRTSRERYSGRIFKG
jgi:hypothetical protein